MKPGRGVVDRVNRRGRTRSRERVFRAFGRLVLVVLAAGILAGCGAVGPRRPPQPGRTTLDSPLVILPAQLVGNHLLIETKWDRFGPYRFLIDTGSSVTLLTPELVRRYPGRESAGSSALGARVVGADGRTTELPRASFRRLELGDTRFDDLDVLIYDCAALSAHLGVRIDGVLGFPLFRETLLTLDYPGRRVLLQPARGSTPGPGSVLPIDSAGKTPLVTLRVGDRSLVALIDSGSDALLTLNPIGVAPQFAFGPTLGATVGTIAGEHTQLIGRLAETVTVGDYTFEQPIVEITDELSAIGGEMLRHFSVTFDQVGDRVTFYRDTRGPIATPPRRSAGVSFSKTPAYWRVAGVVPESPAVDAGVQPGDLVVRINGEPVARWDLRRYDEVVGTAGEVVFTFLEGVAETEKRVRIFDLVP